ncbi:MAG: ATP-binding protein [Flavobacteriales bacterium]
MSITPWRNIATPHADVLQGTFKQSEFAADITQVHTGTATPEYQDAEKFFARTFITEGMKLLLISVAQRLAGRGGDPVIQLQTSFGGGKTHTMLAVYHLASRTVPTDRLLGIPPLLDEAKIADLPIAKIAVIDGINLAPSEDSIKVTKDGKQTKVSTLWGEIAYQLLGDAGLDMLRESHEQGTSPGKAILVDLLQQAAPCVILIDELVAYLRQFEHGKTYKAGTFDSNLSFIQALTEAMKAVPNAILLASLPESEVEVGGVMGQLALTSLEKYFGRVESVWKPVEAQESFEIVRRRLFESAGDPVEVARVCRSFHDFYIQNSQRFPKEVLENSYFERMCQSYPIHPEVFDRLYEDWSTLDKFQKTRGVLQYMAIVIHNLWQSGNSDAMILPATLPLADPLVRNKSIHYLPAGWEPVIEKEVDGERAIATDIDKDIPIYGSVQAARRVMRTIFLGSAASNASQGARGIKLERILLGTVQPEQSIGVFEDVLKKLRDKLHYLYADQDRFWLDTKPNLRREMESRKQGLSEQNDVQPEIKTRLQRLLNKNSAFGGFHIFTSSQDIPDDLALRLVVLPTRAAHSRTQNSAAIAAAEKILQLKGEQPRQQQNRLIFLAADHDVISRLREQVRSFLAWRSIVHDITSGALNHDMTSQKQAKQNQEAAEKTLESLLREAFKWLLVPSQTIKTGKKPELEWEQATLSPAAPGLIQEVEKKLRDEDWLISEWSPIHLKKLLADVYFKDGKTEFGVLKVWEDTARYLYMPRMVNFDVFRNAVIQGMQSKTRDYFAVADGKDADRYLGFSFGIQALVTLDSSSVIIEQQAAAAYQAKLDQAEADKIAIQQAEAERKAREQTPADQTGNTDTTIDHRKPVPDASVSPTVIPGHTVSTIIAKAKTHFYATTTLDPIKAKLDFATIMDEVVEQLTATLGVEVTISIEIEAKSNNGFDEQLQRSIKENCSVLKFKATEFD